MENQGDQGAAGSHFEKLIFGDEAMVSKASKDAKFSKMSLAVAKDSGWYEVDMETGDHYLWGKNKGCHLFSENCDSANISEFCSDINAQACNDEHVYITICKQYTYTGECRMNVNVRSCKEQHDTQDLFYHGPEASCLETFVSIFDFD